MNDNITCLKIYNNETQELKSETFILDSLFRLEISEDNSSLVRNILLTSSFNIPNKSFSNFDFAVNDHIEVEFNLDLIITYLINLKLIDISGMKMIVVNHE